jgi:membrane-associated phospholipid phosphatase
MPGDPPSPSFLARRLTAGHPRDLYLTVAILVGVSVTAIAFLMQPDGREMDGAVAAVLHEHACSNPVVAEAACVVTAMGSAWAIGVIAVVVGVALARWRRFDLLACWLIGLAGGGVFREALKQLFQRPRPAFPDPLVVERGMSFPSGHALGSVVCFGLLAYFVLLAGCSRRTGLAAVGGVVVLVSAVGLSRLYIGAHYPTDVLAGYAAGLGWLAVWLGGWETVRRGRLAAHHDTSEKTDRVGESREGRR